MSVRFHPHYDVSVVAPALESLHEHVTRSRTRVELTRRGTDERCVLISLEELAALEYALELFANTDEYRGLASGIAALAAATEGETAGCAS